MTLIFIAASVFVLFMLVAAFYDLFTMTIPNELNGATALLFFLVAYLADFSAFEMAVHTSLGFGVLVICFTLFVLNWIQGGDAKLAAAVAMWMGPDHALMWFVYMGLIGGVLTLSLLSIRQFALPIWMLQYEWISRLHHPKTGVPYGIAIAAGAIIIYPETRIFTQLMH
jgi:prepilin peptidase CpaA